MHNALRRELCIFFNYTDLLLNDLTFLQVYSTIIIIVDETGNIEHLTVYAVRCI